MFGAMPGKASWSSLNRADRSRRASTTSRLQRSPTRSSAEASGDAAVADAGEVEVGTDPGVDDEGGGGPTSEGALRAVDPESDVDEDGGIDGSLGPDMAAMVGDRPRRDSSSSWIGRPPHFEGLVMTRGE